MKKILIATAAFVVALLAFGMPHAASMLGVSSYAATKVVDAILMGLSVWSILALVAVSGGALAVVMASIKTLVVRVGKKAAIAW